VLGHRFGVPTMHVAEEVDHPAAHRGSGLVDAESVVIRVTPAITIIPVIPVTPVGAAAASAWFWIDPRGGASAVRIERRTDPRRQELLDHLEV
jgi:hypothetical protein